MATKKSKKKPVKKASKKPVKKSAVKTKMKAAPKKAKAKKAAPQKTKAAKKVTTKTKTKAAKKKSAPQKTVAKITAYSGTVDWQDLFTPLDDRMVVEVQQKSHQTAGGIYIPDSVVEEQHPQALVLAVGRGHKSKKGHLRPMDVKVGDRVLFNEHSASPLKIMDQDVLILREQDVLGIIV